MDAIFSKYHSLEEETRITLKAKLKPFFLKKGESLLAEGNRCKWLYFLDKGSVKLSYSQGDKTHANWIYFEDEIFTSWYSFSLQQPSIESLVAVENCEGVKLSFESIKELETIYTDFALALNKYYLEVLGWSDFLTKKSLTLSAKDKYNFLLENHPLLFQRASNTELASIMGVSRETISRIR